MTDDLKVKDFWQLSPDEQVKMMESAKAPREYLVRGTLNIAYTSECDCYWCGGHEKADAIQVSEIVEARSVDEAIKKAEQTTFAKMEGNLTIDDTEWKKDRSVYLLVLTSTSVE